MTTDLCAELNALGIFEHEHVDQTDFEIGFGDVFLLKVELENTILNVLVQQNPKNSPDEILYENSIQVCFLGDEFCGNKLQVFEKVDPTMDDVISVLDWIDNLSSMNEFFSTYESVGLKDISDEIDFQS